MADPSAVDYTRGIRRTESRCQTPMPHASTSDLLDSLRAGGLLNVQQVAALTEAELSQAAETLADDLLRRGWITRFQADRLAGREHGPLTMGPYVLLDRLGAGGMGEVFKARHRLMDRVVALKVIRADRHAGAEMVARFRREIQATARLSHPNIVVAHGADQVGETCFYVMEYVEGFDLARLVR